MSAPVSAAPVDDLALRFAPALVQLQQQAPSPLPRAVLRLVVGLVVALLVWSVTGHLDIVVVAQGRLVPATYLKVVQPADAGIVREILVQEGDTVRAGQVLVRMDGGLAEPDRLRLMQDLARVDLQLRRIAAELDGTGLDRHPGDPPDAWREAAEQLAARRGALRDARAAERAALEKARHDHGAASALEARLESALDHHRDEEQAWATLHRDGFAGRLQAEEKRRRRTETERELEAQHHAIGAAAELIRQSEQRLAQLESQHRQQLTAERLGARAEGERLAQELAKQAVRQGLLELRAPQDGVVKELATHTPGAVVSPGTVLMTIVPVAEALRGEVWVGNDDIGFIHPGQSVKLKVASYPFQKYGLLDGTVVSVSADASDPRPVSSGGEGGGHRYRALVDLPARQLRVDGVDHPLAAGMLVDAEIRLGERRVIEYVLSPVRQAFHEAGRER